MPPASPGGTSEEMPESKRPGILSFPHVFGPNPGSSEAASPIGGAQQPFFPCPPSSFSASSRALLREGLGGGLGCELADLQAAVWGASGARQGPLCDFQCASELVSDAIALDEHLEGQLQRRRLDWASAGLMLHYERLLWGASPSGVVDPGATQEGWGDPLRANVRKTALALNKAIKGFAQAELRERREGQQHMGPRSPPRIPQPLTESDGGSRPDPPPATGASQVGSATPVKAGLSGL